MALSPIAATSPTAVRPTVSPPIGRLLRMAAVALTAIVALTLWSASEADAQRGSRDHVVAPWGNNAGPGTNAQPWRTLTHAMRQLQPGETLYIRNGTYRNQMAFVNTRGRADAWIKIRPYPGENPVIEGQDGTSSEGLKVWGAIHLVEPAAYLDFRGLHLRGVGNTVDVAGLSTWRVHNIQLWNSNIHHFGGGGVNATYSENLKIINNNIHHNAFWSWRATSGVSVFKPTNLVPGNSGYTIEIRNNYIWANEQKITGPSGQFTDGNCIVLDRYNDVGYTGRSAVVNNVCARNGGRGVHVFRTSNVDVFHNTLFENARTRGLTGEGELSTYQANNVKFINNLAQPIVGKRAALPWLSSNLVWNNNVYAMRNGAQPWQISNGSGDRVIQWAHYIRPVVDYNGNFGLRGSSPARGLGRRIGVTLDKTFASRVSGIDPGAYDIR